MFGLIWAIFGIKTDYRGDQIDIPTKKPRKSKKNPAPQLSDEQKAANTALSQLRIFIEHAIGGMKRYNILVHVFRNRKTDFEDDAIGICAGLWNFALSLLRNNSNILGTLDNQDSCSARASLPLSAAPDALALSRQDKLGVSCKVKVLVG